MGGVLAICNDGIKITGKSVLKEIAPVGLFSDNVERYRLRIGSLNMPIKYFCSDVPSYLALIIDDETFCFRKVA